MSKKRGRRSKKRANKKMLLLVAGVVALVWFLRVGVIGKPQESEEMP